jgi:predicted dithiol-disulfide oxidoreductase (DUF899 family)
METTQIPHPPVATREQWLAARRLLLDQEKMLTREYDRINAQRRRLPMVKLEKAYQFQTPDGEKSLLELFEGQRQLVIYHFMFDPEWDKGCPGCTSFVDSLGDISGLKKRNTTFALVSRAPLSKLEKYKSERGWTVPWYSSFGSDFNYDFDVSHDETIAPISYNFEPKEVVEARRGGPGSVKGEDHGLSVFFELDGTVYHTNSTYARGVEMLADGYALLDQTPYGRQEDFEDSPEGWPQSPTYG